MSTHAVALSTSPYSWEGRILNGKYQLLECLETAGVAAVYLTKSAGAAALLKLVPANGSGASAQVAAWTLASQLSHPNLVRIFDMGLWHADDEQDMQFAVMEYCDESLAGVLRQRELTVSEARQLLAPTLDTLKYLHAQGIVHGQITPASILARGDQLKLTVDCLRRTSDTYSDQSPTPYDAPEKASGTIAPSGDLWMLGVTLHEALTRRLPVRDCNGALESAEKLPAPFDEIVRGCLAREREQRLSIAAIKNLLDRPGPELVQSPKPPTAAQKSPAVPEITMTRPIAARAENHPAPLADVERNAHGNRRALVTAGCALALLFALLLVAHFSDSKQSTAPAISANAPASAMHAAPAKPNTSPSNHSAATTASAGAPYRQVMPEISGKARSTINGTVKLRVRVAVDAEGKVSRATLAAHVPSAYFARQSLEAARQWTFTPPIRDGKAQASDWMLRFEFRRGGTKAAAERI
ncbi:MAG TPA: TonB family protein [Terriglobales bacterium]|nr:TonB family protein [Terriglobales bacterium]